MATKNLIPVLVLLIASLLGSCVQKSNRQEQVNEFSGSASCIQCHEKFYELWSTSHHGKAMQPVNRAFFETEDVPSSEGFLIEGKDYRILCNDSVMTMIETEAGRTKEYAVTWALGGKNVYYFLTPMEKGKLQTIPLAYDVRTKMWYNNPESAVRHFPEGTADAALPWRDRMYTFNTSCYSCHVSQLATNFDLASDSYNTTWKEPGINCETCHGPSAEHVRVCLEAGEGNIPDDLKIITTSTFTPEQHNASCAPCHAKMQPITASFMPGERYFDNYTLTTLENADFYPDGRDLGENYTYTTWMMNECMQNSEMHCVTCHTSSGRDRFADNPNQACISCHRTNVENVAEHSMHPAGSEGAVCINCHMPKTEFGRMVRSDHSFRPPMPQATIQFGSPNACNICHTDKSPEWANQVVKKRTNKMYQDETLYWAQLIKEARNEEWKRVDEMFAVINNKEMNEVVVTSLIRLLANCPDNRKWEAILGTTNHESPLVRAAAASSLMGNTSAKAKKALITAAGDDYRLVRISAAQSLAGFTNHQFNAAEAQRVEKATDEYMHSLVTRPDDWSSHYNEGIFHQNRGDAHKALQSYEHAARLYPESLMPLINSSILYSHTGNPSKAEENLQKAVAIDPSNEAANLNLGLLLAEQGRMQEAESALKAALEANPRQAVAAYNLSVISAQRSLEEAVRYAVVAAETNPQEPKYSWTLAYYQYQQNQTNEAVKTLKKTIADHPLYLNAVSLLADIYMREGNTQHVKVLYEQTLKTQGLPEQDKRAIQQALQALGSI
ncbi:MAG: ammonia-forming cytochrome c nitrite reductase subunit c552 [Mariniphaga sp.]